MEFQELKSTIKELRKDHRKKIVEGKRDKEALEEFKIKEIEKLDHRPLRKVTSETEEKEVILLTDYDETGKKLSKDLIELYRAEGIKTDLKYKRKLGKVKGMSEIEELPSKYEELKQKGD